MSVNHVQYSGWGSVQNHTIDNAFTYILFSKFWFFSKTPLKFWHLMWQLLPSYANLVLFMVELIYLWPMIFMSYIRVPDPLTARKNMIYQQDTHKTTNDQNNGTQSLTWHCLLARKGAIVCTCSDMMWSMSGVFITSFDILAENWPYTKELAVPNIV